MSVDADRARLDAYLDLLLKWNKAYNLTAVRDRAGMETRHIQDSLAIRPWLRGETVLDVGTGAGLPGLVLAMVDPRRRYTVLDANGKKVRFCEYAIDTLGISNAEAVQARVEGYRPAAPFGTVVSRAFASLKSFVASAGQHCAPDGVMLAMKGTYPGDELDELPRGWHAAGVHRLEVPGLDADRHLVELTPDRIG
jgi:16S rRNA (guanine527-N7)-methyltransferase